MNDDDHTAAADAPVASITLDEESAAMAAVATGSSSSFSKLAAAAAASSSSLIAGGSDAQTLPAPQGRALDVFKLSVKEAFKTGLTPRKGKMKDAGGNHEKGGKLWAGCMEVLVVVSTVAVAWTFLRRFTVGDYPEGAGGGGSKRKGGYTLVVSSGGGDSAGGDEAGGGGGVELSKLPTSTKPKAPPSALAKTGKNMFGASSGKKH